MRTLALSGWGQPHDALAAVAPHATHFEYAHYTAVEEALSAIAAAASQHDRVVAWSLGAQLAMRAIGEGVMRPERLVLIGAPYQFVETPALRLGMKRDTFEKFRDNYRRNPSRTLDKGWELVVNGDRHEIAVRAKLHTFDKNRILRHDWLHWLNLLDGFTAEGLDFTKFPPTLLIHGENDAVVDSAQTDHLAKKLPQATPVVWPHCGHAPHWHDTSALIRLMGAHADV